MSDLIAKAKKKQASDKFADQMVSEFKSLKTAKEQEAFAAAVTLTLLDNASWFAWQAKPFLLDYLRLQIERDKAKKKPVKKDYSALDRYEQAIIKTFKANPSLLTQVDGLDEVAKSAILAVVNKHLEDQHDQQDHDPTKGKKKKGKQKKAAQILGKDEFESGELAEALALAVRLPKSVAENIGEAGASVNTFFEQKSGSAGRAIHDIASVVTNSLFKSTTPLGQVAIAGQLVKDHGPFIMRGGFRQFYRYGGNERPVDIQPKEGSSPEGVRAEVHRELLKRLPTNQAAVNSGRNTPSEGYIIDKDGKVIAHAIGRGGVMGDRSSDHFTPYTLSQMKSVSGNDLIRRRAWGGLTEEDLRLGLLLGARSTTVVSNNGTFTVRFTGEGQGINSEMPLILNRLTELRGKNLTGFGGESSTVQSLTAEFPIHFAEFNSSDVRPGDSDKAKGMQFEKVPTKGWLSDLLGVGNSIMSAGQDREVEWPQEGKNNQTRGFGRDERPRTSSGLLQRGGNGYGGGKDSGPVTSEYEDKIKAIREQYTKQSASPVAPPYGVGASKDIKPRLDELSKQTGDVVNRQMDSVGASPSDEVPADLGDTLADLGVAQSRARKQDRDQSVFDADGPPEGWSPGADDDLMLGVTAYLDDDD